MALATAALAMGVTIASASLFAQAQPYPQQPYPQQQVPQQPRYDQQGAEPSDENPDDPSRGVARISILQGDANVRRGDSGEMVAAAINAPLLAQDHIITAANARAEVQFDSANMVRLAPNTDLGMADLAYHKFQIQLAQGTIMYSVVRQSKAEVEIDTPSISIRPLGLGEYRISILADGSTQVTVRAGQAEIFSPQGTEQLAAGRTMFVRSGNLGPEFQTTYAIATDEFDQWNVVRDQQLQRSQSVRYVSPDIYGADDLDQYGRWVPSQYGQAWVPNDVGSDWAPYRDGQWSWADYYGWTWVDSAPWGWAPYHYGRWFQNGAYGWSWYPGPVAASYYWRPALVGFFGFGDGFGIGFGFGNIGWCPLAPYERYHPWYGRGYYGGYGHGSYNNTYIARNTNIYNTYRNARVNNGVSYASANRFGQGRQTYMAAHSSQLTQASLVRGQVPLAPTRQSLNYTGRGAYSNVTSSARSNQQFFTHQQPASTLHVPFTTQASHLAETSQRALGSQPNRGFASVPAGGQQGFRPAQTAGQGISNRNSGAGSFGANGYNAAPRSNAGSSATSGGWHTFGQPSGSRQTELAPRSTGASGEAADGWHSFGAPMHTQSYTGNGGASNSYQPRNNNVAPSNNSNFGRSYQSNDSAQPLRVSPPMMQQRQTYSAPSQSYSAPRSSYSAPQNFSPPRNTYSAPQSFSTPRNTYSAPHNTYSAPRNTSSAPHYSAPSGGSHGGGGGSSSRSSGGGGSHSSSGGGSHSTGGHH
jgi:FecR protein